MADTNLYARFVEQEANRLVKIVMAEAAKAVGNARSANLRPLTDPHEFSGADQSDFISAMIEKLQDAGF
jgi:hypothetical protein